MDINASFFLLNTSESIPGAMKNGKYVKCHKLSMSEGHRVLFAYHSLSSFLAMTDTVTPMTSPHGIF